MSADIREGVPMHLFTIFFLIYFAMVTIIKASVFRIHGEGGGNLRDNWTFPTTFASYLVVVMGSLAEFFLRNPQVNLWVSLLGYLLATAGVVITRRCVFALGRWWSVRIETKKDHQVVREGPYRVSRHPYYLATLLELGGLCLILNSYRTFLYLALIHLPLVVARITSEERILTASLGTSYLEYKRSVRVLPFPCD
jgi:protein-S-isoprenylcysteine O-methyltransferase Ste14